MIASVRTGSGELLIAAGPESARCLCVALKYEPVTSATRSDSFATAKAARKLGTYYDDSTREAKGRQCTDDAGA